MLDLNGQLSWERGWLDADVRKGHDRARADRHIGGRGIGPCRAAQTATVVVATPACGAARSPS
ncbi:hypothetical protein GCM10023100_18670 [Actinocorallia cavernae]|uniref:Uncharacterized protein n=2 Tax=Actinomycetes TaxID=1760 RepID=A0ABP8SIE1_9ACTN